MSNEVAVRQAQTTLAIAPSQTRFTPEQVTMLGHIGVEEASDADLQVFFHQCQRTGLDPFARQIYMIGREERKNVNGAWVGVTKQTIQTGIDGYRLIGRRAAQGAGETISVKPPVWAHPDGGWRDVWLPAWGTPAAAKVTIMRNGEEFTAVALFDEYKQAKRNGELTRMWAQRPAGQIAKCAEALAWRMAFPQDLSGIYTEEEMGQADNPAPERRPAAPRAQTQPSEPAAPEASTEAPAGPVRINEEQWSEIAGAAAAAGLTDAQTGQLIQETIGRQIAGATEIQVEEIPAIMNAIGAIQNG